MLIDPSRFLLCPDRTMAKKCCSCHEDIGDNKFVVMQKGNPATGAKEQVRCGACNNAHSRINRMLAHYPQAKEYYKEVEGEDRVAFYKACQSLCGAELKKMVYETVTKSFMKKQSMSMTAAGAFHHEEDIRVDFQSKPIVLENILKHGHRMFCPVKKCELIWVPEYKLSFDTQEVAFEETNRKVESEKAIKGSATKKAKVENPKPPKGNAGEEDQSKVTVTVAQLKRVDKLKVKFDEVIMWATGFEIETAHADVQEYIPPRILSKFSEAKSQLEKFSKIADEITETKEVTGIRASYIYIYIYVHIGQSLPDRFCYGIGRINKNGILRNNMEV